RLAGRGAAAGRRVGGVAPRQSACPPGQLAPAAAPDQLTLVARANWRPATPAPRRTRPASRSGPGRCPPVGRAHADRRRDRRRSRVVRPGRVWSSAWSGGFGLPLLILMWRASMGWALARPHDEPVDT